MSLSEPPVTPDEEFLHALLDRAIACYEDGRKADLTTLLEGRTHLREEAVRMIGLAGRVAQGAHMDLPGVAGYEVLSEIGRGGMGVVYLARQQRLGGRLVALKLLAGQGLSPRARERFRSEAMAIARLKHPNIVSIYDIVRDDEHIAYAMEWIEGQTLGEWIEHHRHEGGTEARSKHGTSLASGRGGDVALVCRIGASIARALAVVHQAGLLHRDVKPGNILIRSDGTPLLSDFGLAREVDSTLTEPGNFAGTVAYAPPEQLRGAEVDARSDIYALGVTLYHALAGELPFSARDPVQMLRRMEAGLARPLRRLNPRVPRDLETVIAKAMEGDAARRYQTAADFGDDLQRVLNFQPIRARRAGPLIRAMKFVRRNRGTLAASIVASVLTLALAGGVAAYLIAAPRMSAAHVREARLALLDPGQASAIVSDLYWGSHVKPHEDEVARREHALDEALRSYDAALAWWPLSGEIRTERGVIESVRRGEALPEDLRSLGLYSFLQGDYAKALQAWQTWEDQRDPLTHHDPLVDAALGVLHLFREEPGRAYPRLLKAVEAFPDVSFLRADLAEAALRTGDLVRAEKWLQIAEGLSRPHARGLKRIRAALLAANGQLEEADRAYRADSDEGPWQLDYARFLETRGRWDEALERYARVAAYGGEMSGMAYRGALERWWALQGRDDRLKLIWSAVRTGDQGRLLERLRLYTRCASGEMEYSAPASDRRAGISNLFRSAPLESLSLSELANRMEVNQMVLWKRIVTASSLAKEAQFAAWHWPILKPVAACARTVSHVDAGAFIRGARGVSLWGVMLGLTSGSTVFGQMPVLTTQYATAERPVALSFDANGNLFAGRDAGFACPSGSPDPARIHRIGTGSASAVAFGPMIDDPDIVLVDRAGTVTGVPGSVLVGGSVNPDASRGRVTVIHPDQSSELLFESTDCQNISGMAIQSNGRLIISASGFTAPHGIFAWDGSALVRLATTPAPISIALDSQDRIYVSFSDDRIRLYDPDGQLLNDGFVIGAGKGLLAFGRGDPWDTQLYFFDWINGELDRFDSSGNRTAIAGGFPGNFSIEGITFGGDGALYLSDWCESRVLRIVPALLGDMNCDGAVTVSDIGGFVLALTNPGGYAGQFPNCDIDNADMNQDGSVSVSDIGLFVQALTGA